MTRDDPVTTDDRDLEARLQASWTGSLGRATADLADGVLVGRALDRGTRSRFRPALAALVTVGAVLVLAVALILSGGGRHSAPPPSSIAGQPTVVEATPAGTAQADESGTPFLDPGVTFPPIVEGQRVLAVGGGAETRLASIADASPVYVSGWVLDADRHASSCNFDVGSPAPNGVFFKPCTAILLRERPDGGAELGIHWAYQTILHAWSLPGRQQAMRVLIEVHAHDPGCTSADCAQLAVFDRVVAYGTPRIDPAWLAAAGSPPATDITLEQAIRAALDDAAKTDGLSGGHAVVLSVSEGPKSLVDPQAGPDDADWVWDVRIASDDGYQDWDFFIDYGSGSVVESRGGSVTPP